MRCIDMIGQRFGKLVVVSRAENDKKRTSTLVMSM